MRLLLILFFTCCASGCATTHHKLNTIEQADGLSDIFEKQVLNNLARMHCKPHSIPHFAVPESGLNSLSNKGSVSGAAPLNPFFKTIGFSNDRTSNMNWTLLPLSNPDRLRRIKNVIQNQVRRPQVILTDAESVLLHEEVGCDKFWYCVSTRKPHGCANFGSYCGTYVWVDECNQHQLTDLVLKVLENALSDPTPDPPPATKIVKLYMNAQGQPTSKHRAEMEFDAEVPIEFQPAEIRKLTGVGNKVIRKMEDSDDVVLEIEVENKDLIEKMNKLKKQQQVPLFQPFFRNSRATEALQIRALGIGN